jgi:hypothetical protein
MNGSATIAESCAFLAPVGGRGAALPPNPTLPTHCAINDGQIANDAKTSRVPRAKLDCQHESLRQSAQSESNEIICDRSYHFVITVVEGKRRDYEIHVSLRRPPKRCPPK